VNTPMVMNEGTFKISARIWRTQDLTTWPRSPRSSCTSCDRLGRARGRQQRDLFLVSDEARFITGVALPVDGGALIK